MARSKVPAREIERCAREALAAAVDAGKILMTDFGRAKKIELKGEIDLVTQTDRRSQEFIVGKLSRAFPGHSIIAEEGYHDDRNSPFVWFIDPLDGTTNFAHGFPCFCVSIALQVEDVLTVGVIHNPILDETFTAISGKGARLNGKRVSVSKTKLLTNSLLATGFPYDLRKNPDETLKDFFRFAVRSRAIRRAGSAALDLAYVACGRFDGFWERTLKTWDMAAGALMVTEAGGRLTDYDGGKFKLESTRAVATNGLIHRQMIDVLEGARKKKMRRYWPD